MISERGRIYAHLDRVPLMHLIADLNEASVEALKLYDMKLYDMKLLTLAYFNHRSLTSWIGNAPVYGLVYGTK